MRALAALALCACTGTVGTLQVELITAPDSHVLDGVERMRLTITDPRQVVEATRSSSGFNLAIEVDASNTAGSLIVEGFDGSGALIACGQSPRFPESAIDATIAIYMAPPRSIGLSPSSLSEARNKVSAAAISYGAVLAGGRDSKGAPSSSIAVYNTFDHSLVEGSPLLAPRAELSMATGIAGGVYLFGGIGPDGGAVGTLWRFDTTVAPLGLFVSIANQTSYARSGQQLVAIGRDHYLITGTPPLEYVSGNLTARTDFAALPSTAAEAPSDDTPTAIFVGSTIVRFRDNSFDILPGTGRTNATATTLPDGRVAVIGGGDPPGSRDALVIDGPSGTVTVVPDVLTTPRILPLVAATSRHVVVAGGSDQAGMPIATAEVLDAKTLAPIVTLPTRPRSGGFAIALPNNQVLLGGGTPADAALELFNPEPPP